MVGSILFRGPYDSTPAGTVLRIWATGCFRAYVIVEAEYSGAHAARSGGLISALQAMGWQRETGSPTFGDTSSTMQIWSWRANEGQGLTLPPIVGDAVFSVVVANVASSPDRLSEELKKSFRVWDPEGRGAISATELDGILQALCPRLDKDGRQAILAHADRSGSGRISYTEFADLLMFS